MTENSPAIIQILNPSDEVTDKIIVTLEGEDKVLNTEQVGLDFDSTESEIMDKVVPVIKEEFDVDITDYYKVQKSVNSRNIHIIPNATAGI